jgi:hypothetical protein
MNQQDPDKIIHLVQSSTRNLMSSFRDRTDALRQCSKEIKHIIREGYDKRAAYDTALKLFGKEKVKFLAIDGRVRGSGAGYAGILRWSLWLCWSCNI